MDQFVIIVILSFALVASVVVIARQAVVYSRITREQDRKINRLDMRADSLCEMFYRKRR